MHLKELTFTGFKAYPSSQRIQFSPHLTTVTGSNGSGKSSIISAILFALNGTDSPADLVNVTCKIATVTLKFSDNNSITRTYDKVTRINKFKINNSTVTTHSYTKFLAEYNLSETSFYSIQQGSVTKLINMSKAQMSDFVKQMAGTKFYEEKTLKAIVKLEEKEKNVKLSKTKITETISPFFYKLKEFRESHLNFQRKNELKNKIDKLKRINYKNSLNEIKKEIQLKLDSLKEESKEEIENKFLLLKSIDEINQSLSKISLEEVEEDLEKKVKLKESLQLIPNKYLEIQEKFNAIFSKEVNDYSKKTDQLIEVVADVKIKLQEQIMHKKYFDYNFIQSFKKEILLYIEKNHFDFKELNTIDQLKEETIKLQGINGLKNKLKELKDLYNNLKNSINYPLIEGVYGKVSDNFTLLDNKYFTAVHSILGNRGSFIIVDNEDIASALLETDQPITLMPLNKVRGINNKLSNYTSLLDCIKYDKKVGNAMQFIFNNVYLATTKEMANEICYKHKCMAVMLDGTVYDPKGTMTVGNYEPEKIALVEHFITEEMMNNIEEYNFINVSEALNIINNKVSSSIKGINLLKRLIDFLEGNSFFINDLSTFIKLIDLIREIKTLQKYKDIKNINDKTNNLKDLERKLKEEMINEHKKYVINEKNKSLIDKLTNEINELNIKRRSKEKEKLSLENDLLGLKERLKKCEEESKREELKKEIIKNNYKLKNEIRQLMFKFNELFDEAEEYLISSTDVLCNRKGKKINSKNKENTKNKEDSSEESVISNNNESDKSSDVIILKNIKLIKELNLSLDKLNINYNTSFYATLPNELNALINEYNTIKHVKKYKMDPKNFDLLEKNEKTLQELESKILLLENDKIKITKTLNKLSIASNKAVINALLYLNNNLTKYIQYFLPGITIKVNDDYTLNIQQENNEVSINALSGGQRSLIALCLLFTALSYNPSPFYIFDEIDAALDVKYCSQIGELLKKEIKAQFIVVSLRDEMAKQGDLLLKVVVEDNKPIVKQINNK